MIWLFWAILIQLQFGIYFAFTTQCWEVLNGKENMFADGACQQINMLSDKGWKTQEADDWQYYPRQYVNVSLTAAQVSVAIVGGCCAPNRHKTTGFLYQDDGSSYAQTGHKIVAIADRPMTQDIFVTGWYMKKFVDDHAMNLTIIPTTHHSDKQAIFYEIVAFDRAMLVNYQFFDYEEKFIGNHSSGLIRNQVSIPDITLPRYTRHIRVELYGSRADPICFSYLYAGLYVYSPFTTLAKACSKSASILQYASLINFVVTPVIFAVMTFVSDFSFPPPIRFLCRTPSHKILMCIIVALGSFILNQAWNILNSQSSIFDRWLPRAAKIIELFLSFFLYAVYFYPIFLCYHASYRSRTANLLGFLATCILFGLRLSLDLPSLVITYARNQSFLIINVLAAIPTLIAYCSILLYFATKYITFQPCYVCEIEFLEVQDIEEQYVKMLMKHKDPKKSKVPKYFFSFQMVVYLVTYLLTEKIWEIKPVSLGRKVFKPKFLMMCIRKLFGVHQYVRIPFAIKTSLILLLYCLGQLIPLLLTQMIGVGGVVPRHICNWAPYLTQFQHHPDPIKFAVTTFYLLQWAVYIATLGAGGFCMIYSLGILRRFTKDILRLRKGDYFLFKGKKDHDFDLDDAIRFLGVFIGFGFTGTLYFMLEISLIGAFITAIVQLDRIREAFFRHVGYSVFFVSFFIALIVQLMQQQITNLIFIESRSRFTIQNRSPLLHYWYFMMLTSMTRALTSYLVRTLKLALRYPLFSLRVDRNAETWNVRRGDGGFTAYCGMLLAEHEYNNPIVLVFIECLMPIVTCPQDSDRRRCRTHKKTYDVEDMMLHEKKVVDNQMHWSRAKSKWFLAYTLIHNPGLRVYRTKKV